MEVSIRLKDLLHDPEIGGNLKIVILVRDPRGVMLSRAGVPWWIVQQSLFFASRPKS